MALLTVKVPDPEYAGYKARAAECGMTLSQWVRMILAGVVGGGMAGSFPSPPQAGAGVTVPSPATNSAPHDDGADSAAGSGLSGSGPCDAAAAAGAGTARSSGSPGPGTHRIPDAATPGMGATTAEPARTEAVTVPSRNGGAPTSATLCPHPRDHRQVRAWGTFCGACGRRLLR